MAISNKDTICAIATPPGQGGIGVVRVSGPKSREILSKLWRGNVSSAEFESRKLYLGELSIDSEMIDRVMAVIMPAPHTYTGQDVVEFSCHGSPIVLKRILNACIDAGARMAEPGEFTRRAFLSGKCDLAQAEAVAELIHATSEKAAKRAAEQLSGKLSNEVTSIDEELAEIRKFIEASIDFPEEDIEFVESENILEGLAAITDRVSGLLKSFDEGRILSEGIRTAIVGKPNVGKSSLLNALVGEDRAIVHHTPGTTRDMVEANINIEGYIFNLRDTAGLRNSDCEVEGIGIARSRNEIEKADLILAVFDAASPFLDEDKALIEKIDLQKTVIVLNKIDLGDVFKLSNFYKLNSVKISSTEKTNINELKKKMIECAVTDQGFEEGVVVMNSRHKESLGSALRDINEASAKLKAVAPLEVVAQHLGMAQESLGGITGEVTSEDILDRIFETFCIGK